MASPLAIWTVGHSSHDLDVFARLIAGEKIEFLVDVRSFPYSRFAPWFNREHLQEAMGREGIGCLFLGEELGGRPTRDDHYDADGRALYALMSQEPSFRAAIQRMWRGG